MQKLADEGRLADPAAKILNVGVIAAAVGHLAGDWGLAGSRLPAWQRPQ